VIKINGVYWKTGMTLPLWDNPYFLHEQPRRLRFLCKIYYNNRTCLMTDRIKGFFDETKSI